MTLIKQNICEFNHFIQLYGCRFRCLQAIAEMEEQKSLSIEQINDSYNQLTQNPAIMNKNCLCGMQEHCIINMAFQLLGNNTKTCRQIGIMKDGNIPMGWNNEICPFDYIIFHWHTQKNHSHYTLADKNSHEIFDPWNNCKNDMCKIYIKRKLLYKIKRSI